MPRSARIVATLFVVALLLASVYFGLANADDIVNTITVPQRLVGITATACGVTAVVALYGLWRRRLWLARCLSLWAALVVITAGLAAAVYARTARATTLTMLVAATLVAPVIIYGYRRRAMLLPSPQAAGGTHAA